MNGNIYAFNRDGRLIASSEKILNMGKTVTLPEMWKQVDPVAFVNKHINPFDGDEVVALVVPISASFSTNYQLGTLVMAYHWSGISASLPSPSLLLYNPEGIAVTGSVSSSLAGPRSSDKPNQVVLMDSRLGFAVPQESLAYLTHRTGSVQIGNHPFLINSAQENTGLLAGWEVVMLHESGTLSQHVHSVILKLAILGLILTLPLILAIRWLAGRLTAPLRELTKFVTEITGTHDLSKRLKMKSSDEIGILAADFNLMTERLERGSRAHRKAEGRLRATIDNALDAVVQMSSEGAVTGWNDQAVKIFGWTREEAVGMLLHDMIIPPQYREQHIRGMKHYLASGEGPVLNSRVEMTALNRDGHEFPIELAITVIEVQDQNEFSAFIRDITVEKKTEELIWQQAN